MAENKVTVYIYQSEYDVIVAEAQKYPSTETGGTLFGTWTHGGMFVVWLASGPGKNARGNYGEFAQDTSFMNYWQQELMERFALQHIGGWHSHHIMGIDRPSGGDTGVIQNYARNHHRDSALEIIVTHKTYDRKTYQTTPIAYFYYDAQKGLYTEAGFMILKGESPLRSHVNNAKDAYYSFSDKEYVPGKTKSQFKPSQSEVDKFAFPQSQHGHKQHDNQGSASQQGEEQTNIPELLEKEIKLLCQKKSNLQPVVHSGETPGQFMVVIPSQDSISLYIVLSIVSDSLKIEKVSFVDEVGPSKSFDITSTIAEKVSSSSSNLVSIVNEAKELKDKLKKNQHLKEIA